MAFAAILAELRLVDIVILVTGDAFRLGVAVFFILAVAFAALDPAVPSSQRKVGFAVIEAVAVEPDNLRVPALVVGVTGLAFG